MRSFALFLLFIILLLEPHMALSQVRVRHGILGLFQKKEPTTPRPPKKKSRIVTTQIQPNNTHKDKDNTIDEHFYIKWGNRNKLEYDDFKNNKNLYNKFISEKDSDLVKVTYPDYRAFYDKLKERVRQAGGISSELQEERIEKMLQARLDSLEAGYISSVTLDIDLSLTISIDSPAASALSISPIVYAVNENSYYYNISALFSKYESWMIVRSKDILQHEQLHFDIFELYARKMRKYLAETLRSKYQEDNLQDISADITPYYDQLYQQLNQMQLELDRQTAAMTANNAPLNSINTTWANKLKALLAELEEYSMQEGIIVLKQE